MNKTTEIGVLTKAYEMEDGDDFYHRFLFGHGNIRSCAYGKDKQLEYDESFNPVFQNLVEMKIVKDKCIKLMKNHAKAIEECLDGKYHGNQIDVNEPINDELNIFFKDFFIRGQMAIDGLIKHSIFMDSNIGFFFADNEKKFRNGLKNFILKEEDERFKSLNNFITNHKTSWYISFRELRVKIEHHGWSLPKIKYGMDKNMKVKVQFPTFPNQTIEQKLDALWQNMILFCEEVTTFLLSLKLPKDLIIVYLSPEQRDKHVPARYIVSHKDFPGVRLQC